MLLSVAPLKARRLYARKTFGLGLGIFLCVAGTHAYGSSLPIPGGVGKISAEFEQILGFPNLFLDTGRGTAALSELKMPIPESALSAATPPLLPISSVERGFFNLLGTLQTHSCQDGRGNTFSVTQGAPLTQVQTHIPGSGNRLDIVQMGRGATTALQLAGDNNRVGIRQTGPETKINMKVKADATDISVQQASRGATLIFSGTIKGTLSIKQ